VTEPVVQVTDLVKGRASPPPSRSVCTLADPTSGSARVAGYDVRKQRDAGTWDGEPVGSPRVGGVHVFRRDEAPPCPCCSRPYSRRRRSYGTGRRMYPAIPFCFSP